MAVGGGILLDVHYSLVHRLRKLFRASFNSGAVIIAPSVFQSHKHHMWGGAFCNACNELQHRRRCFTRSGVSGQSHVKLQTTAWLSNNLVLSILLNLQSSKWLSFKCQSACFTSY